MEKSTLWSRIGAWLRGDEPGDSLDRGSPESTSGSNSPTIDKRTDPNGPMTQREPSVATGTSLPSSRVSPSAAGVERQSDAKFTWSKRPDSAGQRGDAASYDRLTELVGSIQEHLKSQVQEADVLVEALDRLAEGIERLPDTAKGELGALERIGNDLATGLASMKRLENAMARLPELTEANRDAMRSIGGELERLRDTDGKIVTALEGLQQVLVELKEGIGRSAGVMRDFRSEMAERHDRLAEIVEIQSKRLTWFSIAVVGLGLVAVIVGAIGLLR
jgi:hypothetical protein